MVTAAVHDHWAAVHQMTAEAIEADGDGHNTAKALVALLYGSAVMWSEGRETPWLASVDNPVADDERTFRRRLRGFVVFLALVVRSWRYFLAVATLFTWRYG